MKTFTDHLENTDLCVLYVYCRKQFASFNLHVVQLLLYFTHALDGSIEEREKLEPFKKDIETAQSGRQAYLNGLAQIPSGTCTQVSSKIRAVLHREGLEKEAQAVLEVHFLETVKG